VKAEGNKNPSDNFKTKMAAVDRGKELAKRAPICQIKIHRQDGKIQTEHTYGEDPKKYRR
jgi:hypothetical protein